MYSVVYTDLEHFSIARYLFSSLNDLEQLLCVPVKEPVPSQAASHVHVTKQGDLFSSYHKLFAPTHRPLLPPHSRTHSSILCWFIAWALRQDCPLDFCFGPLEGRFVWCLGLIKPFEKCFPGLFQNLCIDSCIVLHLFFPPQAHYKRCCHKNFRPLGASQFPSLGQWIQYHLSALNAILL